MGNRDEVKAFLTSRRAKLTPGQAGLTAHGRGRRVPGLRRSEVADLAGVSVEYYAQIERGDLAGVSDSVLDAVARALQLDEAEHAHLLDLARAAGPAARTRRRPSTRRVRPGLERLLDLMVEIPVIVNNARLDAVAANPFGRALFAPVYTSPVRAAGQPVNHARFTFLDPHARDFWLDWERAADDSVSTLRTEAGRDPHDRGLIDLVGELGTRSDPFRVRWAAHDVRLHRTGRKQIHHPAVGDLHLDFEVMELPADPGLSLIAFYADAGSPDADGLRLLSSWAATQGPAIDARTAAPEKPQANH
ncbi:helix-turn-helix domain-containing protein [Parafrankia sp. EUN1f]|uniref:helix-turn-helix domain-containing protein n=1 Tax=Parafrankia sp. EUN1f TaxID=102897 RepID=UPI0001C43EC1|nr:helix-turn-helix transcriptional regulator [Parafrankia sp. EUN1f]EFC84236.1 transcriptional regulator, XRE family [Parafrankia sp. EUN1f]